MDVEIEVVREASDEMVAAFGRLLPQLSGSAVPPDRRMLGRLVGHEANTVLVARVACLPVHGGRHVARAWAPGIKGW